MQNPIKVYIAIHEPKTLETISQEKIAVFEYTPDWQNVVNAAMAAHFATLEPGVYTYSLTTPNWPVGTPSPCHGVIFNRVKE